MLTIMIILHNIILPIILFGILLVYTVKAVTAFRIIDEGNLNLLVLLALQWLIFGIIWLDSSSYNIPMLFTVLFEGAAWPILRRIARFILRKMKIEIAQLKGPLNTKTSVASLIIGAICIVSIVLLIDLIGVGNDLEDKASGYMTYLASPQSKSITYAAYLEQMAKRKQEVEKAAQEAAQKTALAAKEAAQKAALAAQEAIKARMLNTTEIDFTYNNHYECKILETNFKGKILASTWMDCPPIIRINHSGDFPYSVYIVDKKDVYLSDSWPGDSTINKQKSNIRIVLQKSMTNDNDPGYIGEETVVLTITPKSASGYEYIKAWKPDPYNNYTHGMSSLMGLRGAFVTNVTIPPSAESVEQKTEE